MAIKSINKKITIALQDFVEEYQHSNVEYEKLIVKFSKRIRRICYTKRKVIKRNFFRF